MENPTKMDDLGGKTHHFRKHPSTLIFTGDGNPWTNKRDHRGMDLVLDLDAADPQQETWWKKRLLCLVKVISLRFFLTVGFITMTKTTIWIDNMCVYITVYIIIYLFGSFSHHLKQIQETTVGLFCSNNFCGLEAVFVVWDETWLFGSKSKRCGRRSFPIWARYLFRGELLNFGEVCVETG